MKKIPKSLILWVVFIAAIGISGYLFAYKDGQPNMPFIYGISVVIVGGIFALWKIKK